VELSEYPGSREAADPYCLRVGEAAALLAGHPYRRLAVLGDSGAEGISDPVEGYVDLHWAARIDAELRAVRPELEYRNLGRRDAKTAQVRDEQLPQALEFGPDLALVLCGANDARRRGYDPDAVAGELAEIVTALRSKGADVMTFGSLVLPNSPAVPEQHREGVVRRQRLLARRTAVVAAELGTIHVHLVDHPVCHEPDVYSRDGLHGNLRTHAIAAAETLRALGAHLGNRPL
jgi:lysophospholipase L1-like esterase